jgi:hypothetical protein
MASYVSPRWYLSHHQPNSMIRSISFLDHGRGFVSGFTGRWDCDSKLPCFVSSSNFNQYYYIFSATWIDIRFALNCIHDKRIIMVMNNREKTEGLPNPFRLFSSSYDILVTAAIWRIPLITLAWSAAISVVMYSRWSSPRGMAWLSALFFRIRPERTCLFLSLGPACSVLSMRLLPFQATACFRLGSKGS